MSKIKITVTRPELTAEEKAAIEKAKKEAVASQKTADFQDAQSDDDLEVSIGWEIVLKVFGWITLVGCIIAFFVLLEDYYLDDMAWMPLVLGIVQIAPIMVFANISISLKKANALKQKILNEMKQMNKTQKETK